MEDDNLASFVTVPSPTSIDVNIAFLPHITTLERNEERKHNMEPRCPKPREKKTISG